MGWRVCEEGLRLGWLGCSPPLIGGFQRGGWSEDEEKYLYEGLEGSQSDYILDGGGLYHTYISVHSSMYILDNALVLD